MSYGLEKLSTSDRVKLAAVAAVGLAYFADFLSERRRPTPIWSYKSNPGFPLNWDKYARIATNPLMKLVAGDIVSHHWDWTRMPDREDYSQQWYEPNEDKFYDRFGDKKLNFIDHAKAHVISGVQEVSVLGLDLDQLGKNARNPEGYHYAYQVNGEEGINMCRILIPIQDQVRILVSTEPLRVLTLDPDGNELPSIVKGPFKRNDPRFKRLRQF